MRQGEEKERRKSQRAVGDSCLVWVVVVVMVIVIAAIVCVVGVSLLFGEPALKER